MGFLQWEEREDTAWWKGLNEEEKRGAEAEGHDVESLARKRMIYCGECFEGIVRRRPTWGAVAMERRGEVDRDTGNVVPGEARSMRSGRCQRCWAIDHTERRAHREIDGRPLCKSCWSMAD